MIHNKVTRLSRRRDSQVTSLHINKRVDPGSDPYRNVRWLTVHSLCHKTLVQQLAHARGERCDAVAHLGKCHGDPQNSPSQLATVLAEPGENTLLLIRNEVTRLSRRRDSQVTSLRINIPFFISWGSISTSDNAHSTMAKCDYTHSLLATAMTMLFMELPTDTETELHYPIMGKYHMLPLLLGPSASNDATLWNVIDHQ